MAERKTVFTASERLENARFRLGLWERIVVTNTPSINLEALEWPDAEVRQLHPQLARTIRNAILIRSEIARLEKLDPNEIADISI